MTTQRSDPASCLTVRYDIETRSSAIAEGPRDALSQLKSCQLLDNYSKIAFEKE